MSIRAVFFDLGGVILRTEYQAPRQYLAERLNVEYEDLMRLVFESETSREASLGKISMEQHWDAVVRKLHRPAEEGEAIHNEFFGGDVLDLDLIRFIRSLRQRCKTGLISNAWSDARKYIQTQKFDDAFDAMIISAEVGVTKPKAEIYQLALKQLDVKPNEAVFVDDFIENVKGAQAVGMSAIHFEEPKRAVEQIIAALNLNA